MQQEIIQPRKEVFGERRKHFLQHRLNMGNGVGCAVEDVRRRIDAIRGDEGLALL